MVAEHEARAGGGVPVREARCEVATSSSCTYISSKQRRPSLKCDNNDFMLSNRGGSSKGLRGLQPPPLYCLQAPLEAKGKKKIERGGVGKRWKKTSAPPTPNLLARSGTPKPCYK